MSYNYTTINSGKYTLPYKPDKNTIENTQDKFLRAYAIRTTTGATYLYIVTTIYDFENVVAALAKSSHPVKLTEESRNYYCWDKSRDTLTIKIGFIPAAEFLLGDLLEENVDYPVVFQDGKVTILENSVYIKEKKEMKENNMLDNVINTNKQAAVQAGYLKAGRVANKALEATVRKRFPALPDTPFTGLVLANLVDVLGKQVKPSAELARVSGAMVTAAYLDMYDVLDLEGIVEELLASVPEAMKDDTVKVEA